MQNIPQLCHHYWYQTSPVLCIAPPLPYLSVTSHILPSTPCFTAGYKPAVTSKRPSVTQPYSVSFYRHHSVIAILPLTAYLSFPLMMIFMFVQTMACQKSPAKLCDDPLLLCGLQNATIQYKSTSVRQDYSSFLYSQIFFFLICSFLPVRIWTDCLGTKCSVCLHSLQYGCQVPVQ